MRQALSIARIDVGWVSERNPSTAIDKEVDSLRTQGLKGPAALVGSVSYGLSP
jgi:hypothetical protein